MKKILILIAAAFLISGCEVSHSSCFSTQKRFVGYSAGWMPHHAPKPVKRKSF